MTTSALRVAIAVECDRQQVGPERHAMLLEAWSYARSCAALGLPLTLEMVLTIGELAEPDSQGRVRVTPVTFANGGSSASPDRVLPLLEGLVGYWAEALTSEDEVARAWLKEFLWIHPLKDGNGRLAWVLQQWLFNTWDNPAPLIDFGW